MSENKKYIEIYAIFNNIPVISQCSVLLVEEGGTQKRITDLGQVTSKSKTHSNIWCTLLCSWIGQSLICKYLFMASCMGNKFNIDYLTCNYTFGKELKIKTCL